MLFDDDEASRSRGALESAAVRSCDDVPVFADDCRRAMRMARDDLTIWSGDPDAYDAELGEIVPFRYKEGAAPGFVITLVWYETAYQYRAAGSFVDRVSRAAP